MTKSYCQIILNSDFKINITTLHKMIKRKTDLTYPKLKKKRMYALSSASEFNNKNTLHQT